MEVRKVGIILNGVTGRMGMNQHLVRSILSILREGGIRVSDELTLLPDPVLTGRSPEKLRRIAEAYGPDATGEALPWTTDLDAALGDERYAIFFDASSTAHRPHFVDRAVDAGKAIYCEKPTATSAEEALRLARRCEAAGLSNGVVQDKLWLPGMRKLAMLRDIGVFGRILSVRAEFGYWVFTGHAPDQPAQRPAWNYQKEAGGGIMIDMFCHWRYLIDRLFGPVQSLVAIGATDIPERVDEHGRAYRATADDSAYAIFQLQDGTVCQFNSSWCTRVRRDDLLTVQVDGTEASAVAGLREAWVQDLATTPKPVWNPDIPQPIDFFDTWQRVPTTVSYANAFKAQWTLFLRHVALGEHWPYTLREGAKGVQLGELGLEAWRSRRWVDVPALDS